MKSMYMVSSPYSVPQNVCKLTGDMRGCKNVSEDREGAKKPLDSLNCSEICRGVAGCSYLIINKTTLE